MRKFTLTVGGHSRVRDALRLVAVALAIIWVPCTSVAQDSFRLTKGNGVPVCEAYLQRLNNTSFAGHPRCDRPENDSVPGFARLNRVYLGMDEIKKLFWQSKGFLGRRDPRWYFDHLDHRSPIQRSVEDQERVLTNEIAGYLERADNWGPTDAPMMRHYRYEPPVDIDNDGIPDQIVIWREMNGLCGNIYTPGSSEMLVYTSTHALILDAQGNIDGPRTQTILGHPKGGYVVTWKHPATGKMITDAGPEFRPIGRTTGIFIFQGKTYFDTYYDSWGDIENRRKKDPHIGDTLAVFKREHGRTDVVCELQY